MKPEDEGKRGATESGRKRVVFGELDRVKGIFPVAFEKKTQSPPRKGPLMSNLGWRKAVAQPAEQETRLLGLHDADVSLAMCLARQLLWPRRHAALAQSRAAQESLWGRGLSGDNPVTMLRVRGPEDLGTAELLLRAHALFRRRGRSSSLLRMRRRASRSPSG